MPCSRQSCSTVFCPTWPSRRMATICSSVKRFFITALSGPRFYRFKLGHFRGAGQYRAPAVSEPTGIPQKIPMGNIAVKMFRAYRMVNAHQTAFDDCEARSGDLNVGRAFIGQVLRRALPLGKVYAPLNNLLPPKRADAIGRSKNGV